eukprot:785564-Pelagomonas_calceolata.AAC.3
MHLQQQYLKIYLIHQTPGLSRETTKQNGDASASTGAISIAGAQQVVLHFAPPVPYTMPHAFISRHRCNALHSASGVTVCTTSLFLTPPLKLHQISVHRQSQQQGQLLLLSSCSNPGCSMAALTN